MTFLLKIFKLYLKVTVQKRYWIFCKKKADDVDEEAAQLHVLKKIIIDFINQIKNYSFSGEADIKLLYERVNELEEKMKTVERESDLDEGETTKKVSIYDLNYVPVPDIRVLLLPACKMVSSGYGFFGEEKFDRFDRWFSEVFKDKANSWEMPQDFLWYDPEKGASVWWYVNPNNYVDTQDFDMIDFEGGMYVAAVSRDGDDEDGNRVHMGVKKWIEKSGILELDERPGHYTMCHIITDERVKEALGFQQLEILVPVKKVEK